MSSKRVVVATLAGLILGLIEALVARSGTNVTVGAAGLLTLILGRGVLGFAIAVSCCRMGWWLHGLLMGFIFSLPLAFGAVWVAGRWAVEFWIVLVVGLVVGLLIELVTAVIFRAKAPAAA